MDFTIALKYLSWSDNWLDNWTEKHFWCHNWHDNCLEEKFGSCNWLDNCLEENFGSHNWLDNCLDNFFGKIIAILTDIPHISDTGYQSNSTHIQVNNSAFYYFFLQFVFYNINLSLFWSFQTQTCQVWIILGLWFCYFELKRELVLAQ